MGTQSRLETAPAAVITSFTRIPRSWRDDLAVDYAIVQAQVAVRIAVEGVQEEFL